MTRPGLREQVLLCQTAAAGDMVQQAGDMAAAAESVVQQTGDDTAAGGSLKRTLDDMASAGSSGQQTDSASTPSTNQQQQDDYFIAYDSVEVHRLMVRDAARTEAYRKAVLDNSHLFRGKVVMDLGAGTGVLSLFAMQAGASKVYAVEASGMVGVLREIVALNDPGGVVEVLEGRAEDLELPGGGKVDIIISEWMGFYLLHESMLDSVILARQKHLQEDGIMFPSHARILAAPVRMDSWVAEQFTDWSEVYGFNMTPMAQRAMEGKLSSGQPEILSLPPSSLLALPETVLELDLRWCEREEVAALTDTKFVSITSEGSLHGVAIWFDVTFCPLVYDEEEGTNIERVVLGTGPCDPATHWKQTVLLLLGQGVEQVEVDEVIGWRLSMEQAANNPRQYSISLQLLDPESEPHPTPCGCRMGKCALIKALLEKEEDDLEEMCPNLV